MNTSVLDTATLLFVLATLLGWGELVKISNQLHGTWYDIWKVTVTCAVDYSLGLSLSKMVSSG